MKTPTITITITDVQKAGSIEKAIIAWACEHDTIASGVIGMSFATSGPGSGWTTKFGVSDYADRAVSDEYGALAYLDADDGRLATRPGWTEEGTSGEHAIEWTEESVIRLECPAIEDAMEHPELVAEMAQAVIDYHHPLSDVETWKKLIISMRDAAEAVEDIDVSIREAVAMHTAEALEMEENGRTHPASMGTETVGDVPFEPSCCECDNTHQGHDTVCRWCWAKGRRHWNDPEAAEETRPHPDDERPGTGPT